MYQLKITSAIAIGGSIKKAGSIVEVDEQLSRDLLRRGKAELIASAKNKDESDSLPIDNMTKAQLSTMAEQLEIDGWKTMNKQQLYEAIKKIYED